MNVDHPKYVIASYPESPMECENEYSWDSMVTYFSRFPGGLEYFVRMAYYFYVQEDGRGLAAYNHHCTEIFDNSYQPLFEENTVLFDRYASDRRELHRRLLQLYRYACQSLHPVKEQLTNYHVRQSNLTPDGRRVVVTLQRSPVDRGSSE